jgi:hypothetical protein
LLDAPVRARLRKIGIRLQLALLDYTAQRDGFADDSLITDHWELGHHSQPIRRPLFCSSSQVISGLKYSIIAREISSDDFSQKLCTDKA